MIKNRQNLDWKNLGFSYIKTDFRFIAHFKEGKWNEGELTKDNTLNISEASTIFHYGQSVFEGLKAFETKSKKIILFRPEENAKRLNKSAKRLMMQEVPIKLFLKACKEVVKANSSWIPPYESGASLYIRPYLIGVGDNLGLSPAKEYIFGVFVSPVGPYFKSGFEPVNFIVSEFDRAAPNGVGAAKTGGNYAASMLAKSEAVKQGFSECIYLDAKENKYIEEAGAANFFAITKDNIFVTPKSDSILPSITKYSLIEIAKNNLGLKVEEREIPIESLNEFNEAGACGTAAVITPIGKIQNKNKIYNFGKHPGKITKKLYETLTGIQKGEIEAPKGWLEEVDL